MKIKIFTNGWTWILYQNGLTEHIKLLEEYEWLNWYATPVE